MIQREWHGIDGTVGLGYWTHKANGSLPLAHLDRPIPWASPGRATSIHTYIHSHPSTNQAQHCLTLTIIQEWVDKTAFPFFYPLSLLHDLGGLLLWGFHSLSLLYACLWLLPAVFSHSDGYHPAQHCLRVPSSQWISPTRVSRPSHALVPSHQGIGMCCKKIACDIRLSLWVVSRKVILELYTNFT